MIYPLIDTMRVSLYTQNILGENMDDSSGVRAFIGLRNYYDLLLHFFYKKIDKRKKL